MRLARSRPAQPKLLMATAGWVLVLLSPLSVRAQGTSGPTVSDSKVGYVDSAILGNLFRLRYDSAYGNNRPSRAEFFYAQTAPGGPGLPFPEPRVDYQDITGYLEVMLCPRLSGFVEVPSRFLNPEVNSNATGLSDLNAGLRYSFFESENAVATLQLRAYAPTGDVARGLGNGHASLEPALLFYRRLGDRFHWESELRYWVPLGGTDFAGDIIRYGSGISFPVLDNGRLELSPVLELVGWTVLSGKESVVPSVTQARVQGAAGDTLIHGKVGLRLRIGDHADIYGGYGRPLTGERWYDNTFRLELRLLY
ncbi:MAG: hypothetical protein HY040_04640 [Planctomycetes bacterium]|nr:hypothetical protein [Planctomycetota bacterium]